MVYSFCLTVLARQEACHGATFGALAAVVASGKDHCGWQVGPIRVSGNADCMRAQGFKLLTGSPVTEVVGVGSLGEDIDGGQRSRGRPGHSSVAR